MAKSLGFDNLAFASLNYDSDKQQPSKTNCSDSSSQAATLWWDDDDAVLEDTAEDDAMNTSDSCLGTAPGDSANRLSVRFFVAAMQDKPSLGLPLMSEMSLYLNQTLAPSLMFHVSETAAQNDTDVDAATIDLSIYMATNRSYRNGDNDDEDDHDDEPDKYHVVALHTDTNLVVQEETVWWWQYGKFTAMAILFALLLLV